MEYATIYCAECGHAEYVLPRHAEEVSVCFVCDDCTDRHYAAQDAMRAQRRADYDDAWPEPYNALLNR